jgi:haloacetate dehalogenase
MLPTCADTAIRASRRVAPDHSNYAKRAMALDQVRLMEKLGFAQFAVVGHDRGGRVAHRLARDHRERVTRLCVLDISPTLTMFDQTDQDFARAYYHWFFLTQPSPHPEHMIGQDPQYYLRWKTGGWGSASHAHFDPRAYANTSAASRPGHYPRSCEDYRAAAEIDLDHDRADLAQKITCPVLALWGGRGVVNRHFKPIEDWSAVATDVRGKPLPSGHYIAEESPELLLAELLPFLAEKP